MRPIGASSGNDEGAPVKMQNQPSGRVFLATMTNEPFQPVWVYPVMGALHCPASDSQGVSNAHRVENGRERLTEGRTVTRDLIVPFNSPAFLE